MFKKIKAKILWWVLEETWKGNWLARKLLEHKIVKEVNEMGIWQKLQGYKTYILGFATIVGLVAAWVTGSIQTPELVQGSITALLGMTIRHGIDTTANQGVTK